MKVFALAIWLCRERRVSSLDTELYNIEIVVCVNSELRNAGEEWGYPERFHKDLTNSETQSYAGLHTQTYPPTGLHSGYGTARFI